MKYNYRQDYTHIFDTPAKMEQESVVVNKIMDLLNNNYLLKLLKIHKCEMCSTIF